uniref:Uncharacterized protein n=1 Tax=Romanomermis culicivorax TaxID=13658 RepID=A0A915LD37_ROMCU
MIDFQLSDSHVSDSRLNFHTFNDERLKHVEMFKNYTADYGYLK